MNADALRSYRFSTDAHWAACLFMRADRDSRRTGGGIRPFAPYARPAVSYESRGGHAPVATQTRQILWVDDDGTLHRLEHCGGLPETHAAPYAIARASRLVATPRGVWVIGDPPDTLQLYDENSLTRLLVVGVPNARIADIASDGRDFFFALVQREDRWEIDRIDCAGHIVETTPLTEIKDAQAFVYLRRSQRFVVLGDARHPRLYWLSADKGEILLSLPVAGLHPCFSADTLGSDAQDRVFLAGTDGKEFGSRSYVLIFDADGNALGDVPLDGPATGVVAIRDSLLVTGQRGLSRFQAADVVPENSSPVQFTLMTPMLFSPDREDRRRWLRVEATTTLPEGSTLEIAWVATDKDPTRDRLNAIRNDESISASQRIEALLRDPDPDLRRGTTVFQGSSVEGTKTPFAAKLFDVSERYLWLSLTLTAAAGGRLPRLSELAVLYPGRTLMEDLPSIYQREEQQQDSFLRALVGVLETTTQNLDALIASMGKLLHPSTASEPWLDFIARWLGIPWDDALELSQKKAIVSRAADLAKGRGTRAGLEALLDALFPGTPRRFRVTDATADYGFAIVGGNACSGSALPAMLGGHTRWSAELDASAVLGFMRLPCDGQRDDGAWQLAGRVRIDIAATATERAKWAQWLPAVIREMVPLTARIDLRWVTTQSLRTSQLDGTLTLEPAPVPHLGTDAITSLARLPDGETRLTSFGPSTGTRLR